MKILVILILCAIVATYALPQRAPTFVIRDGKLVRSDQNSSNGRIVGGGEAEQFSAPWVVSLQWGTVRPSHFCAGSIIHTNWVLTAGHCTLSYPNFGIRTVVAGIHDLTQFTGIEQIRHVTLRNTWTHEEFDGWVGPHDISLLLFQTPFTFDATVGLIALPDADEVHTGMATLHGWGSTSDSFYPVFPNVLHTANLPIVPLDVCRANWNPFVIDDTHICAGSLGVSACELDDGGALVQNGEIVGLVAFGALPCGQPNRPTVYTRVSAYISWIDDIMSTNIKHRLL